MKNFLFILVFLAILIYFTGVLNPLLKSISGHKTEDNNILTNSTDNLDLGGNFSLINQDGQVVKSSDFFGKFMLVLFGFSSCKSICPLELGMISEILPRFDNKKLQAIFITIDPKRDTIQKLKEFHSHFDQNIQMLTGDSDELKNIADKYKVYVENQDSENINHSSIIYLIGPDGKYVSHFSPDLNSHENQSEKLFKVLERYIKSND